MYSVTYIVRVNQDSDAKYEAGGEFQHSHCSCEKAILTNSRVFIVLRLLLITSEDDFLIPNQEDYRNHQTHPFSHSHESQISGPAAGWRLCQHASRCLGPPQLQASQRLSGALQTCHPCSAGPGRLLHPQGSYRDRSGLPGVPQSQSGHPPARSCESCVKNELH